MLRSVLRQCNFLIKLSLTAVKSSARFIWDVHKEIIFAQKIIHVKESTEIHARFVLNVTGNFSLVSDLNFQALQDILRYSHLSQ